jgi:hypothetical protein
MHYGENSKLLLAACVLYAAQSASENWRRHNDYGNRYEGRISIPVGMPDLELLSFTGYWEPFGPGATLRVRFYLPAEQTLVIESRELREEKQYWMESKPAPWRGAAWNEFAPWPTREVIAREGIATSNLGVVIRPREGSVPGGVVPALVYHTRAPQSVTRYSIYLRPNTTLRTVAYSAERLADGKGSVLADGVLASEKIAGEPFLIELDLAHAEAGPVRLIIRGAFKNRTGGPFREYNFYHRPRVD